MNTTETDLVHHLVFEDGGLGEDFDGDALPRLNAPRELDLGEGPLPNRPSHLILPHLPSHHSTLPHTPHPTALATTPSSPKPPLLPTMIHAPSPSISSQKIQKKTTKNCRKFANVGEFAVSGGLAENIL